MNFEVVQGDVTDQRADGFDCESVVLPALGCGIAGVDLEESACYIFEEIPEFEPETVVDVRVIGYRDEPFRAM